MKLKQIFDGIYSDGRKNYTENLVKGKKVYGEKLLTFKGKEFREWNPFRSKFGAGLKKGIPSPIKQGQNILYLGAAEGTTISHISDIVKEKGMIIGIDISARVMQKLVELSEERENLIPYLVDANKTDETKKELNNVEFDFMFQDISQKNQTDIFLNNAKVFLKKGKPAMISIKARSISQKSSAKILQEEKQKLEKEFIVKQSAFLEPFQKDHLLVYCEKK
ncbi:MAG: fibrillin [Candidatus Diapherotrites archaeon CG10_big_fil_rev_8_21_14_0_10_31_34]|nr:MAG: fibrillin [Candidatus Diapherotrites archaeon CG10_big_fil_rev_8_21_14_0_10_31_34]